MAIVIEETDSGEHYYVLRDIEQRLQEIVWILWSGFQVSEELRSQAGSILQAHEESAQEYMHAVEEPAVPDFHPFVSVPPGTVPKDLPDGGRLFSLSDGVFVKVTPDTKFSAIELDGESYGIEPDGRIVRLRDGRELLLKEGIPPITHEAAGIEGLPQGVDPVLLASGRYRVDLPDGSRLDLSQGDGMLTLVSRIGTTLVLSKSRILGIGETVDVRLLSGGAKSFTANVSGHRGVIEGNGTIHLSLKGGSDLVIRFPEGGDGTDGEDGPCGLVCERRD